MIEIPQEHLEAYRYVRELTKGYSAGFIIGMADAFVWALAALDRSEFEREHMTKVDGSWVSCVRCDYVSPYRGRIISRICDPRHTWTDEQFQQARRANLEGSK